MYSTTILIVSTFFVNVVYSQNCYTPNGERGWCVPLQHCPLLYNTLYNLTPTTRQFLQQSRCSHKLKPEVCCGSLVTYTRRYSKTKPTADPKLHRNINLLPQSEECGVQGLQDKIFGGTATSLEEFPWLVLLGYMKDGRDVGFHCGGMLINNRYILTAAHCVTGAINRFYGEAYMVRLGEYDLRTVEDCLIDEGCNSPPTDVRIEEIIFHSGYDDTIKQKPHDIALLRLEYPLTYTYYVQPVCLPLNGEQTPPGRNMTIAGWGKTETKDTSDVKLKATVPYVSLLQCNEAYQGIKISSNQLCAGGKKSVDSCNGDSGGPIMNLRADQETWYAEGLVSFGPVNCGSEGKPGVYTRIYGYLNWILDNMRP